MSNNNNSVERQNTLDENNQNDINERKNKTSNERRKHFFCNICSTVPIIKFINDKAINYFCKCGEILNFTIIEALNPYKLDNIENSAFKNEKVDNNLLLCNDHKKKFAYYCHNCERNICRKCLNESNGHKRHPLYIFDNYIYERNELIENINVLIEDPKVDSNFKMLVNVIINDFNSYPNYSHFFTLKSCHDYLSNPPNYSAKNTQRYYYIKNLNELNANGSKNLKKIEINQNIENIIDILYELNLDDLVELNLKGNKIKNIQKLSKKKLGKLKILNLSVNEIDNSNINYFFELDFPELTDLNIYQNKITDPKIFNLKKNINNLPKLEMFYIGNNNIDFNDNINIKETRFDLSSITEIGLKNKVFSQSSIKFIQCFTLTNLLYLFLSSNNLENLDFFLKLELPCLKWIYLNDNHLSEFITLKKFKTLEEIEMENNKIENIDLLGELLKELTKLTKFNLKKNNIKYGNIPLKIVDERDINLLIDI